MLFICIVLCLPLIMDLTRIGGSSFIQGLETPASSDSADSLHNRAIDLSATGIRCKTSKSSFI